MDHARRILELTRKIHALAASPDGQTRTLAELERIAEQELAAEDPSMNGRSHRDVR